MHDYAKEIASFLAQIIKDAESASVSQGDQYLDIFREESRSHLNKFERSIEDIVHTLHLFATRIPEESSLFPEKNRDAFRDWREQYEKLRSTSIDS